MPRASVECVSGVSVLALEPAEGRPGATHTYEQVSGHGGNKPQHPAQDEPGDEEETLTWGNLR